MHSLSIDRSRSGEHIAPLALVFCAFFAEAGAFVFGSGLAIVPFLYGGVVNEFVLIWRFKKLPEPVIVLVAAAVGLFVYPLMKS